MSIFISTNTSALRAGYHLVKVFAPKNNSIDRLSSGKKIRNASDDPGGLAVSIKQLNNQANRWSNGECSECNFIFGSAGRRIADCGANR